MIDSLVVFATLSARVADPFSDRRAVLAAYGLDETRWTDLVASWEAELERHARTGVRDVLDRYAIAYAAERKRLREAREGVPRGNVATASGASLTKPEAPSHDVATTADALPRFEPALPFRSQDGAESTTPRGHEPQPPSPSASLAAPSAGVHETVALEVAALPASYLPFVGLPDKTP
jgi:hypothetical protein